MRYDVRHETTYRYSASMVDGYTLTHLLARPTAWQQVISSSVSVWPEPDERDSYVDLFGNVVVQLGLHRPHDELLVVGASTVDVTVPEVPASWMSWEDAVIATAQARGVNALEVSPFVGSSPQVDVDRVASRLGAITRPAFTPGRDLIDVVRTLCHTIFSEFVFDAEFTDVSTPLEAVLDGRRGVCQDFAHLGVACLRSHGLAARYVSGYIETEPPPGLPRMVGADASHAWLSVWVPGWGWLDLDPTNDHVPPNRHVTVGWGRDYGDVTPVRGVVIGPSASQDLTVSVDVTAS